MTRDENIISYLKGGVATGVVLMMMTGMSQVASAQDDQNVKDDDEDDDIEVVQVTGSRLGRSTFNSMSPIQVIDGARAREIGLIDTAEILQSSTLATGIQIDNTFTQFVLDNGPGAVTVGYRGLGADRTLVLINGRRMAPAGVGGAPTAPDLNMIPSLSVARVENLLDGASTVYGSDAIAGVANIILRKDVEGFEISGGASQPFQSGGENYNFSLMWGKTFDRGYINISAEVSHRKKVRYSDRDFTNRCNEYYYEGEDGNIYTERRGLVPGTTPQSACKLETTNRVLIDYFLGNIWATPGETNIGIDGFSDTSGVLGWGAAYGIPGWYPIDTDGDGVLDTEIIDQDGNGQTEIDIQNSYYNFAVSDRALNADFLSGIRRYSAFVNGEYNFEDDGNTTFFYEGLWSKREQSIKTRGAQVFEAVPGSNPYNPCNYNSPLGGDCLGFFGDSGIVDFYSELFGTDFFRTNPSALFGFPTQSATPIINIRGDRDRNDVDVSQFRLVGGLRGNFSFNNNEWSWETSASLSRSFGNTTTRGLNEPRLQHSLATSVIDANGRVTCGDGTDGCVPINMFAPSLYRDGGGHFQTKAERDYLFIDAVTDTNVNMFVFNGFVTGDLFTLPWNGENVPIAVGAEYRRDSITTTVSDSVSQGLLWGRTADKGASGYRNLKEFFGEISLPLVRGKPMMEELTIEASGRITDESFYDAAGTYSFKGMYRPVSWVTFRGTYGTSYRAPNLRERFLTGVTGFLSSSDPCAVPADARQAVDPLDPNAGNVYDATQDNRDPRTLTACSANGVDPLELGLNDGYGPFISAEVEARGSTTVKEETSTSSTYGFVIEQPFSDAFDLRLAVTWFDIELTDSISEPSLSYIMSQCYNNLQQPEGNPDFCNRIARDENQQITIIDRAFINIGSRTSKGMDVNVAYNQTFEVAGDDLRVSLDLRGTRTTEQFTRVSDDDVGFDNAGSPEAPEWQAQANLNLRFKKIGLNWFTRWVEGGANPEPDFDENNVPCQGTGVACRPVFYTPNYDVHTASLTWNEETWTATLGVRNVFDRKPPRIDTAGVFGINNFALGAGYDLLGRTAYFNMGAKF